METIGRTSTSESPVKALLNFGQSPWLDFIGRSLLTSGKLERMIADNVPIVRCASHDAQ